MKKIIVVATVLLGAFVARAELAWMNDYAEASKRAAEEGKHLLLNFSGSDWCGWCIRLDKEVFSQPEFAAYAEANLIAVELDFPRKKALSPGLVQQNERLKNQYGVRGFPTILILSPVGELVQQTGYRPGGAAAYVAYLREIIDTPKEP